MSKRTCWLLGLLLAAMGAICFVPPACAQRAGDKAPLSIEQLLDIKHPSQPVCPPDGKRVAFLWERAYVANVYVVDVDAHESPRAVTAFPDGQVEEVFWSRD